MMEGKLVIISAPSGSGKTTLVRYLLNRKLPLAFSVSACSRPERPHETEGKDYYFLSAAQFREKIDKGEFVEWEEVYQDHFYGTLKSEIRRIWNMGMHVVFDVDVVGGLNIKRQFGDRALAVFIMPPSVAELERRLVKRSTESPENLARRIEKAGAEMKRAAEFDVIIVNEVLDTAKKELYETVSRFLENPQE
ncbi:MAG: guanylate kinase [Marinilabiliales bacterium]|nr:MAG: guanylate kinase [Marinilabiliales bacterium]